MMFLMFLMLLMSTSWCDAYNHDSLDRDGVTGGHGTSQREVLKGIWAWSSSLEAFTFSSAIQSCISMVFPVSNLWRSRTAFALTLQGLWFSTGLGSVIFESRNSTFCIPDASGNLVLKESHNVLISWKSPSVHVISFPFSFEVTLKQEVCETTFYQETGTSMWKISPRLHPGGGLEP